MLFSGGFVKFKNCSSSSPRRKPGSRKFGYLWIPAFAGMTVAGLFTSSSFSDVYEKSKEEQFRLLKKMAVGQLQANCYILGCNKTRAGVVIDPGGEALRITKEISKAGIKIEKILLTHCHFDHTDGAMQLKEITGAPVLIHRLDEPGLDFTPDGELKDGENFQVGTYDVSVIHTPGHSPGGVCFHAPGVVFTGDTLFAGSIGRTDFPGGDYNALIMGVINRIFPLGDDLRVYPGHGPTSTIGRERVMNPFFQV